MVEDLFLGQAVAQVVDGVADHDGEKDFECVIEDGGDPTPGEAFPVSPEVRGERLSRSNMNVYCRLSHD